MDLDDFGRGGTMLQLRLIDDRAFEFSVYNKDVRDALKENRSHSIYGDHWADAQIQDVVAADEDEAMRRIAERYPPEKGFIIGDLVTATH